MHIIELEKYGDFDQPYTESVWYSESNSINIKQDFDTTEEAEKFLKQNGYKKVKTSILTVGRNL